MNIIESGKDASKYFDKLYGKVTLQQIKRYGIVLQWYKASFKGDCYVVSSPGRVELVGNHTDHNGGRVLGCTIDLDTIGAFNKCDSVVIKSQGYRTIRFELDDIDTVESGSRGMVKGVMRYLRDNGYNIGGFQTCMASKVKSGIGISSSASFQLFVGQIINHLYNDGKIDFSTLARAGQYAENVYFNKSCGMLDQGVIACGGLVNIDFKNGFDAVNYCNALSNLSLVIVNTGGSHSRLTEHYSAIPSEMKLVAKYFNCDRLIDVDEKQFFDNYDNVVRNVGLRPALRAKHFFEENKRVDEAVQCVKNNDVTHLIDVVNNSGISSETQLQNCVVKDDMRIVNAVKLAREVCPSCGARVHGGGFAGSVLCVVPTEQVDKFVERMTQEYNEENVIKLRVRTYGATVL